MALFEELDSVTRRSCHLRMTAFSGGWWFYSVCIVFRVAPKNAESRGCNNESCGPPAGTVERGGSF